VTAQIVSRLSSAVAGAPYCPPLPYSTYDADKKPNFPNATRNPINKNTLEPNILLPNLQALIERTFSAHYPSMSDQPENKYELFISYAHRDNKGNPGDPIEPIQTVIPSGIQVAR
jgi:hypothetical protein